ncbi:M81 family metallopeptidase [Limobrevibacterium gyesilva]|uniref:Microcystinase C n=1 Tax=Limobrevibacterium gyesilva TaxID=2991712 RepID=A0AA41YMW8_9PROT|nr:M81 family metallopeptidase [Limobrevibacterium gyesilva]MCW3475282.1 M81 family metallopeptidase [Limobrevibacterium gyesilva]
MPRILLVECMQEISSFNPLQSGYDHFAVQPGEALYRQAGLNTAMGGALEVFRGAPGVETVPAYGARAGSAGLLSRAGWARLSGELVQAVAANVAGVSGIYVSMHGAMGADGELDPEGFLLSEIRRLAGPDVPIVVSLDLHGILTDRMLRQVDGLALYHTYPHVDFADTGARAARLLLRLMARPAPAAIVRVVIPALVRGDELITKSGCYGDLIRECQRLERDGTALAAGIMIGNPFTDVPELCSQVIVMTDGDVARAQQEATRLAEEFWAQRFRMQGKLIPIGRAIAQAKTMAGPVLFTDAADATSSGASGDSNLILHALREAGYDKRALAQIVDPGAARAAHAAGVGATIDVTLGGCHDKARFPPMPVRAQVRLLSDGRARLETMRSGLEAGPTAVLTYDNTTVVVLSRSVSLFDRAMYYSVGLNPRDFDLIVVKSPHTEHHMYDEWVEKNFNIDVPGATSANVKALGHTICARPMYPLDEDIAFTPAPQVYARRGTVP